MTSIPKHRKPRVKLSSLFFVFLGGIAAWPLPVEANHLPRRHQARYVMGTILEITLYHGDESQSRQLLEEAFSLVQRLDDLLSNYKPESEINQLNRRAGTGPVKISEELYAFLELAKSLAEETEGAFDVTVGPLVNLWHQAAEDGILPPTPLLADARSLVGSDNLILHSNRQVELKKRGMRIDTGGLGKGYAADQVAALLKARGINHALINFGHSSVLPVGPPPHSSAWKLLLQFPDHEPLGLLNLDNRALSASSAVGRSFEIQGKQYGHLIDPQLGMPVSGQIRAVVLAPTASVAEALSKYVILRGESEQPMPPRWARIETVRLEGQKQWKSKGFPLAPLGGRLALPPGG